MKSILILLLCLSGCNNSVFPTESERVNKIVYLKDIRTNLCFAVNYVHEYPIGEARIVTNVPCTNEVEKLIAK